MPALRRAGRPSVGLGRAGVAFWVLLELGLLVGVGAGGLAAPVSVALLTASVALALRAPVVGCSVGEDEVTVRSWLRTYRVRRDAVTDVRTLGYSGFANRFSSSRLLSVVALDVAGRTLPHELRFSADTPQRARERAAALRDRLLPRAPHVRRVDEHRPRRAR